MYKTILRKKNKAKNDESKKQKSEIKESKM
jgi:hypothetical protein